MSDSDVAGKLSSALRLAMDERGDELIEVVIEADLPSSKFRPAEVESSRCRGPGVATIDPVERDRLLKELGAFLNRFDPDPLMLRSARAFVAKVRASELGAVAQSPLVRRVSGNRRLGAKGPA